MLREFLRKEDTYCLKGICMLMIIIGHTYKGYPIDKSGYYFPEILKSLHLPYWGGFGVSVFMFLSGYGMFLSLQRSKINQDYVVKKCTRLFEPYILYWIVELIVLLVLDSTLIDKGVLHDICTLSIYPNTENWFFKVIIALYVLIISLFLISIKPALRVAILFMASVVYIIAMRHFGFGGWWYNNILLFPIGAFVASKKSFFEKYSKMPFLLPLLLLFLASWLLHVNMIITHILFALMAVSAIRYININNRLLYYVGANSFFFYFMECPSMDQLAMFVYPCFPLYCLMSLLFTFLLSFVCVTVSKKAKTIGSYNRD